MFDRAWITSTEEKRTHMQLGHKKATPGSGVKWKTAFLSIALGFGCSTLLSATEASATESYAISDENQERTSRISDDSVPELDVDNYPQRPAPVIEWGNKFLGTGNIEPGIELPTGAVWQPSFMVFGTWRNAFQSFKNGGNTSINEFATRLDLFANLQLSGTERILIGLRPLDQDGRFTSYRFNPSRTDDWQSEENSDLTTFFFEGDFGEIFPNLDKKDRRGLDIGFSIGRQPLNYQAGMLINDSIDAIGITRNTLLPSGGSDMQITFLYGWNEVNRGDNIEDDDARLYGLFFATDRPDTTINVDVVYVEDTVGSSDGLFWGVSDVRRIGHYNLSSRILGSHALDDETAAVGDGYLLFSELSWTPAWTNDNVYINAFLGIDNFTSAARGPATGGPLGRAGILFAAVGLGEYGAPLNNSVQESYGAALGYQQFIDPIKNQLIYELGFKKNQTDENDDFSVAAGLRYRHVLTQRTIVQIDAFSSWNDSAADGKGFRFELRTEF